MEGKIGGSIAVLGVARPRSEPRAAERGEILKGKRNMAIPAEAERGEIQGKKASATEGDEIRVSQRTEVLKGKELMASAAEADRGEIVKGKKATASKRVGIRVPQGTEVLKRKEELAEAIAVEGRRWLGWWTTAEDEQPSGAGKKRKMVVVKRRLPQQLIKFLIANPCKLVDELPDDVLAEKDYEYRETYAEKKDKARKINAYHQTLIDQYYANGYADDESEVSDEEEEMVKN